MIGDPDLMRFHQARIQEESNKSPDLMRFHRVETKIRQESVDDEMTIKCKLNGGTACGYTSAMGPYDTGPSLSDEVEAMKSDDSSPSSSTTTSSATSSSSSTSSTSSSSWKEELDKMKKSIEEQDEAEQETAAIHFLVNKLSGERNDACSIQNPDKVSKDDASHLVHWTNELEKRGKIFSRHRDRDCLEEKNLQVFCVLTGHNGDPCDDNDHKVWPAKYRVNKYITSKVSIYSSQHVESSETLGSPVYAEPSSDTIEAIGQDGEWLFIISPEIEVKEAWARQRDGEAQPLVRLGEELPPWPRTHLCRSNKAPCKLRKSTKQDSDVIKELNAWESVLGLEFDQKTNHIRVRIDEEDAWGSMDEWIGLPMPPGVCRPEDQDLIFCEDDSSCSNKKQCVTGGKCKLNAEITCGKDADCLSYGSCVMSGNCNGDTTRICRADDDCKGEDSCRDHAGTYRNFVFMYFLSLSLSRLKPFLLDK